MRFLALTMRCAMVVGLARKAAAISSVVSPQVSRRVMAMRASAGTSGWQHTKISLSWSSAMAGASGGVWEAAEFELLHQLGGYCTSKRARAA
jgi:hypothetical protein